MLVFGDTATMNPEAAGYVTVTKDRRCQVWARTNRVSCVLRFVCACVCVCVIVSSRTFLRTTICNNKGLITVKKTRYGIDNFSFLIQHCRGRRGIVQEHAPVVGSLFLHVSKLAGSCRPFCRRRLMTA